MKTTNKNTQRQFNTDKDNMKSLEEKYSKLEEKVLTLEEENKKLKELTEENLKLKSLVQWYEEHFKIEQTKKFGASSEKSSKNNKDEQGPVFNEAEKESRDDLEEPKEEVVLTKKTRKSYKKGFNRDSMKDIPVKEVIYKVSADNRICPNCNRELDQISEETRTEVEVIPPMVRLIKHIKEKCACRNCQNNGENTPIVKAEIPNPIIKRSVLSPSLMAFIMEQKYSQSVPLDRQKNYFQGLGIELSTQNLSNWVIKCSEDWLQLIYDRMYDYLLKEKFLHADETTCQVLNEEGKKPQSKSYMFLYLTGDFSKQIYLYEYQKSRASKHIKKFLEGFEGGLQTDGYQGYNGIDKVDQIGCFAHAKRNFVDIIKALPNGVSPVGSLAEKGRDYCDAIFHKEKTYKGLDLEERNEKRQEEIKPILDEFYSWLMEKNEEVLPKSSLGKAIKYAINQWPKLSNYINHPMAEASNNKAERGIKNFVIGRKNFMFAKSPKGADASAVVYSIITTAKANGLNPFRYLKYLFEKLPNMDTSNIDELDKLLPFSKEIPTEIKIELK